MTGEESAEQVRLRAERLPDLVNSSMLKQGKAAETVVTVRFDLRDWQPDEAEAEDHLPAGGNRAAGHFRRDQHDRQGQVGEPRPAVLLGHTQAEQPQVGGMLPARRVLLGRGVTRLAIPGQLADGELRPSLRQHQSPDTTSAVAVAALVAEPVRAGILAILRDGPHCVCEMAAALDVKQNNLSNHLARLRAAGLVRASRHRGDARWVYYERDEEAVLSAMEALGQVL